MRFCMLASGSKGNAALLESGSCRLLIDAGLSARQLCRRMQAVDIDPASLTGLLVSHEHVDHVRGLATLARRYNLPVYLHSPLTSFLAERLCPTLVNEFETGRCWQIAGIEVEAFPVTHDAVSPVGFTFRTEAGKLGMATDLGIATRLVEQHLLGCRAVVIESNHDETMLRDGPYPWPLKQRVKSSHGHLSNDAAGRLIDRLLWDGLESLVLAHLSETNNLPALAGQTVARVLATQNLCAPRVVIARQEAPTDWVELT
ncbi:MAG: MBL fold metallo-hydrolase [Desulfuromonadales bacterium]|nr:MBL fold metallo-hydrolase [Desulfuromonadales bacterium]